LDIFVNKVKKVEEFYKEAGYNYEEINLTKEDIILVIDEYIKGLSEFEQAYMEEKIEEEPLFIIRYSYTQDGKPIKREISEKYVYEGEEVEDVLLSIISVDAVAEDYYEVSVFVPSDYYICYETYANTVTKNEMTTTNNFVYAVSGYGLAMDKITGEYDWEPVNYMQEYYLETVDGDVYEVYFSSNAEEAPEVNAELKDNRLYLFADITNVINGENKFSITYEKNTGKKIEDIKNEGALDLSSDEVTLDQNEVDKLKEILNNFLNKYNLQTLS